MEVKLWCYGAVRSALFKKSKCENARTIFHTQALVKIFCKDLCKGGQNAGGGILAKLDGGVELANVA